MEFIFETLYDQKGISAMAKALRKTIRKKRSRRSHIFAVVIIIFAIFLSLPSKDEVFVLTANIVVTWIVILIMVLVLIFEDKLNAYIAKKRMLTGMEKTIVTFNGDTYISENTIGKTEFYYDNISVVAETDDYFVFLFHPNHAQIYDKKGIKKGTVKEFRKFITEKTGKDIQKI